MIFKSTIEIRFQIDSMKNTTQPNNHSSSVFFTGAKPLLS